MLFDPYSIDNPTIGDVTLKLFKNHSPFYVGFGSIASPQTFPTMNGKTIPLALDLFSISMVGFED